MSYKFMKFIFKLLILGLFACLVAFGIEAFQHLNTPIREEFDEKVDETIETTISILEKKEDLSAPHIIEDEIDDVEGPGLADISYESSSSSKHYFYEQLDSYAKKIYDGIDANIDNMKSGNYVVEYGNAFDSILSQENGPDILGDAYQSAIEAFTYDNPQVFFLAPTKMYLNIKGRNKTYNVYIASDEGDNYLADGIYSAEQINIMQAEIDQVKNEVLSGLSGDTKNRIKHIHDYLVDNLSYDQTISKENIYNLYGALINRDCVCEGYAKAFKYLLDEIGIRNVIVVGTGVNSRGETETHAWNYVLLDNNWYAVDVTWDDPIIQGWGTAIPSSYKYRYFLKGSDTMNSNHIPNGQFTDDGKVFYYPNLSNSDY